MPNDLPNNVTPVDILDALKVENASVEHLNKIIQTAADHRNKVPQRMPCGEQLTLKEHNSIVERTHPTHYLDKSRGA